MGSAAFEAYERFLSRPQTPTVLVNTNTCTTLDATKTTEELFADLEKALAAVQGLKKKKDPMKESLKSASWSPV